MGMAGICLIVAGCFVLPYKRFCVGPDGFCRKNYLNRSAAWALAAALATRRPVVLAGGLSPDNVAAAIRQVAPKNTIIATGPNYSDIPDLLTQHPLSDGNVIYNFHFYDPHTFTHQGAGWGTAWWIYTHGLPYPADESSMAGLVKEVPDPASRFQLEEYWLDRWDGHRIRLTIDEAAAWGHANNVPLICNEFGAYRPATDPTSRANWINDVRTALEADGIGWAMWDYSGSFGVVTKKDGKAVVDEGLLRALGMK